MNRICLLSPMAIDQIIIELCIAWLFYHRLTIQLTDVARVDRTAVRTRFRRSHKSLAQNLSLPARNRASPGRLSWIDKPRIAEPPMRAANSNAPSPPRPETLHHFVNVHIRVPDLSWLS